MQHLWCGLHSKEKISKLFEQKSAGEKRKDFSGFCHLQVVLLELFELMHFPILLTRVRISVDWLFFLIIFLAIHIRTRSARNDHSSNTSSHDNISDHSPGTSSERKTTGASRKSVRSQRTIATSATDMSHTSSKFNRFCSSVHSYELSSIGTSSASGGTRRQPFQRLLTYVVERWFFFSMVRLNEKDCCRQRSPVVVTLLPTGRDQSAWLFSRRNGKNDQYVQSFFNIFSQFIIHK